MKERPSMRERLASARESADLTPERWAATTIATSAKAPRLGLLLSRGLDNYDRESMRQAIYLLSHIAVRKHRLDRAYANQEAWLCIRTLITPLCSACGGRKYIYPADAAARLCGCCSGTGRAAMQGDGRVMAIALAALRAVQETMMRR